MCIDWNLIFSLITAVVAIAALILSSMQSRKQIQTSNKQHLFDMRMENYTIATGLIQLYLSNERFFNEERKNEPEMAIDLEFLWLTNNTYLRHITTVIQEPLKEPLHKDFLIKLEEVKNVSNKTKFLFNGTAAKLLSDFIMTYKELLFVMYQYQILIENMKTQANNYNWTREEAQEKLNEPEHREKLYVAIDRLKQSYNLIEKEKAIKKIEEQIKLK